MSRDVQTRMKGPPARPHGLMNTLLCTSNARCVGQRILRWWWRGGSGDDREGRGVRRRVGVGWGWWREGGVGMTVMEEGPSGWRRWRLTPRPRSLAAYRFPPSDGHARQFCSDGELHAGPKGRTFDSRGQRAKRGVSPGPGRDTRTGAGVAGRNTILRGHWKASGSGWTCSRWSWQPRELIGIDHLAAGGRRAAEGADPAATSSQPWADWRA